VDGGTDVSGAEVVCVGRTSAAMVELVAGDDVVDDEVVVRRAVGGGVKTSASGM
jgi:hypothetical protein